MFLSFPFRALHSEKDTHADRFARALTAFVLVAGTNDRSRPHRVGNGKTTIRRETLRPIGLTCSRQNRKDMLPSCGFHARSILMFAL